MKRIASAIQSPKVSTECDKFKKSELNNLSNLSAPKTRGQKTRSTKSSISDAVTPEELLAKNINRLSVTEKQDHQRKSQLATFSLTKKISESKPSRGALKLTGLSDIVDLILKNRCKQIIVMTGAGISTPSGIPDFRTPGSGLYDNLQKYDIPYPEAIFDIDYFTHNPQPFFTLAKELYPGKYKPNFVHYFVKLLHAKGLLLRCYTQNIDGLERLAGIPPQKIVEAHGTFSSASCHLCYTPFPAKEAKDLIMNGGTPRCGTCYGVVKPDIVFFGEDLPKCFSKSTKDFPKADLLIVMGTSLEIEPFADIVNSVRPNVPRLLLNRDLVGPFKTKPLKNTDVVELGELCDITRKLVCSLNWQKEMEEILKSQKL
ncbi:NAD-dependent protein deacetylase sirtuin-3-like [Spea bombifrons]|uniref:NAD-dependent protein deacetylase sirtuin-3-like n=1 Tax=Spea bombifrons TaxID=233779 RepID=UPI00234BE391|nr:NAD-dependent protein deacetylase sirtuin-3-like [Spea bombifrons]